jgi:hypothetical protein
MVYANSDSRPSADLVFKNGSVYTVAENQKWAEAVAVKDGEIVYVGDNEGAEAYIGGNTQVIDLNGKMLLPGFIDNHSHMYAKAEELFWFSLYPYSTMEEYKQEIKRYFEETPNLDQIRFGGVGFKYQVVRDYSESTGLLPKEIIDEVVSDWPVVIIDNGHHSIWVNSKALELAGITKDTPDPQGGVIERDPVTGEPTGILHEFSAIALLVNGLPISYFTVEQNKAAILAYQEMAAERGTTSAFVPLAGESPHETLLEAFRQLDNEGKLTLSYEIALWADENKGLEQVERFEKLRSEHQGKLYKVNSIKFFADGQDLVWDQGQLERIFTELDKKGFRIFVHAIGAPGLEPSKAALDAFEYARKQNGKRDARHALTHINWVTEQDVPRFKELDIVAVPQPHWATWVPPGLTEEQKKNVNRLRSFFDAGVTVASGSDYPVSDFWPLVAVEMGITRMDLHETDPAKAFVPEEGATLEQMIESYTINGAYFRFEENERGSIEVGKKADLVVLEKNLFEIPATEIADTKILMTFFEGKEVFRHPDLAAPVQSIKRIKLDQAPITRGQQMLVPVRQVYEGLDATVTWDDRNRSITIQTHDGQTIVIDSGYEIIRQRAYVPSSMITETSQFNVTWDQEVKMLVLTK